MRLDRHHTVRLGAIVLVAAMALGLAACDPGNESNSASTPDRTSSITATSTLSAADEAAILHMREEEKLARDVYTVLGDQWDLAIFGNIAASEQSHMDAVGSLLDRYGLGDPAATTAPGEFTDPELQALYDRLVAQGRASETAALTVGATIEDLDIADLRSSATSAADVQAVWDYLERGSSNHLRAFSSQLDRRGESYTPQYISQADYETIVAGGTGTGSGR